MHWRLPYQAIAHGDRPREVQRDELPRLERHAQHVVREEHEERRGQRERADAQVLRVHLAAQERAGERRGERGEQQADGAARDQAEQERRRHRMYHLQCIRSHHRPFRSSDHM